MLSCGESESRFNCAYLIILAILPIIIMILMQLSSASVSNVGKSFFMLIINQHLHLEIALQKCFNNVYGKC